MAKIQVKPLGPHKWKTVKNGASARKEMANIWDKGFGQIDVKVTSTRKHGESGNTLTTTKIYSKDNIGGNNTYKAELITSHIKDINGKTIQKLKYSNSYGDE